MKLITEAKLRRLLEEAFDEGASFSPSVDSEPMTHEEQIVCKQRNVVDELIAQADTPE